MTVWSFNFSTRNPGKSHLVIIFITTLTHPFPASLPYHNEDQFNLKRHWAGNERKKWIKLWPKYSSLIGSRLSSISLNSLSLSLSLSLSHFLPPSLVATDYVGPSLRWKSWASLKQHDVTHLLPPPNLINRANPMTICLDLYSQMMLVWGKKVCLFVAI